MEAKLEDTKKTLAQYGQEHLLSQYENLSEELKEKLLKQIKDMDFERMKSLYEMTQKKIEFKDAKIEPISYIDKFKLEKEKYEYYENKGIEAIKQGKLAAVTMAGGQGTRLGHKGPKGTFDLGLDSHESLFALLCKYLKEQREKYGVIIPWYIMTSRENNKATVEFFEENNYFDYGKENIKFFRQNELPMVGTDGKILLDETGVIKEAADGHGGIFYAMIKNDIFKDMKEKGIEWIFTAGVDNPLAKMVDPVLMGYAIDEKVLAAGKSVVKANPQERVGVFCRKNGKPSVIEYTEISKEMAEMVDENGELVYGESHILCNLFNIDAVNKIGSEIPYHSAFKKAKYLDENGNLVVPEEPNAYKFEAFIFDAFERLDDMAIMRVKREEEFAPVKNAKGVDSPETSLKLYKDFYGIK